MGDGRRRPRFRAPINYLVRIIPPVRVETESDHRPFVIIDPRAGHGPGIGGFKQDSQVGVALKAGHPVYFVIFFPEVPGQTLADVSAAEVEFLRIIAARHPKTRKPGRYRQLSGRLGCHARPEPSSPTSSDQS